MRFLVLIFLITIQLYSAQRAVWSGFKYLGKQLDDQAITAINNSFRDELVNCGYFDLVDRDYLDNRLLEKLDDNQNYTHKAINDLLKSTAKTDFLIYGEIASLPDRNTFSAAYTNTADGKQIASVQNDYAVEAGFLPFYAKELARELVAKIKNSQLSTFNRKLLQSDRQKISMNGRSFYLDKYEVTNFYFQAFTDATGYITDAEKIGFGWLFQDGRWQKIKGTNWRHPAGWSSNIVGQEDMPVIHVSKNDALAFCKWAGKRLPTVKEWEAAAGGNKMTKYPYGNHFDDLKGNFNIGEQGWISRKGAFGIENNGLSDMSGNVMEWTSDSVVINKHKLIYIKGGSWLTKQPETETMHLNYQPADSYFPYLGFRCAADE